MPFLLGLSLACGDGATYLVYGGGEATVSLAPASGAGIVMDATIPGATEHILFEERDTACTAWAKEWEKTTGIERTVIICGDAIEGPADGCFPAYDFAFQLGDHPLLESPALFMSNSEPWNGDEDTVVVEIGTHEETGIQEGSFVAEVQVSNPCLGAEPVAHTLDVRWSFADTYDEIAPADDDPGNKPFEPWQL